MAKRVDAHANALCCIPLNIIGQHLSVLDPTILDLIHLSLVDSHSYRKSARRRLAEALTYHIPNYEADEEWSKETAR